MTSTGPYRGTPHTEREFLGVGWRFPLVVSGHGGLAWSAGESSVAESVWLILSTAKGERQMLPRFGCGIHDLVFTGDAPDTRAMLAGGVRDALIEWEARIDVLDVRIEPGDPGVQSSTLLLIYIDYRIRADNAFHNLVYPFYATEGRGV
jgi:hypothetical protein